MRSNKIKIKLLFIVFIISLIVFFLLKTFSENIALFLKPEEVYSNKMPLEKNFRLGGLVKVGSVKFEAGAYYFIVTDQKNHDISVTFTGLLPPLFREGQMAIVNGKLIEKWSFQAYEVLAKHDENYKIKE
jgi:cytochrome c-type biogenesis protein CcmE